MSLRKLVPGEILFKEDDQSKSCYFIKTGRIRLFKKKNGATIEIDTLRGGSLIGELAFLDGQPRSASAEAITDVELVEISQAIMDETLTKTPEWFKVLIKTVTGRVRAATNKIRILESSSSEYETDKWGNRSREFVFISKSELQRFMAALTVIASRYGKEDSIDGIIFPTALLERYASQVLQVHDSKVSSLIELLKTVNVLKAASEDPSKPGLMVTDMKFVDQFQWFINEQNLTEPSKQRTVSKRAFLLLSLLVKYLDQATTPPVNPAVPANPDRVSLNVAPILATEGKSMCNPPLRPDELQELMDQKFVESLTFASGEQLDAVFLQTKLMFEFRMFWILNEIEVLNEKKRKA
jgi:CRP-like cAMP-binding protein